MARRMEPENPAPAYGLGRIVALRKDLKQALSHYEEALRLDPNRVDLLEEVVALHLQEGRAQAALDRCLAQLKSSPGNPYIYGLRGKTCLSQGRAMEIHPDLPSAHLHLGRLYEKRRSDDRAIGHYRRAISLTQSSRLKAQSSLMADLNPVVLPVYIGLGSLYERQGKRKEARKVYEEALAIDPRFAPARNNLAWLYAEQGNDLNKALSLAQREKEILPEDPLISDTLGWIFYRRGLYPTAIRLLREAVEKTPPNPATHYHLGLAYRKNGEANSAKGELREALRLNPEAVHAGEARRLLREMGEG